MLDDAVKWGNQAQDLIKGYADFSVQEHQENLAYNEILTNPDVLSDYTLKFFGPEGPYPVYENEQQLETQGYPTAPQPEANNNVMAQVGQNFPAPPEAAAPQHKKTSGVTLARQWLVTHRMWKVLNQVQPNTVQNKFCNGVGLAPCLCILFCKKLPLLELFIVRTEITSNSFDKTFTAAFLEDKAKVFIDNDFPKILGAELELHPAYVAEMAVEPVVVHDFSQTNGQTVQLDE